MIPVLTGGDGGLVFFLADLDLFTHLRIEGEFRVWLVLRIHWNCNRTVFYSVSGDLYECAVAPEGAAGVAFGYYMISPSAGRTKYTEWQQYCSCHASAISVFLFCLFQTHLVKLLLMHWANPNLLNCNNEKPSGGWKSMCIMCATILWHIFSFLLT